jgi:hypothetical protein
MATKATTTERWIELARDIYPDIETRLCDGGFTVRTSCGRCSGTGNVGIFWVQQGVCFKCGGTGTDHRSLQAVARTAKAARNLKDPVFVEKKRIKARAKAHTKAVAAAKDARIFLAEHPEVIAALLTGHRIHRDMARKVVQYGSLSVKQIAFAIKLAADEAEKATLTEIDVPEGRHTVEAKIVSFKTTEGYAYGTHAYKMLVEVTEDGKTYRAFGTEPASLEAERGDTIKLTATFQPRERGFGFFSRPRVA